MNVILSGEREAGGREGREEEENTLTRRITLQTWHTTHIFSRSFHPLVSSSYPAELFQP